MTSWLARPWSGPASPFIPAARLEVRIGQRRADEMRRVRADVAALVIGVDRHVQAHQLAEARRSSNPSMCARLADQSRRVARRRDVLPALVRATVDVGGQRPACARAAARRRRTSPPSARTWACRRGSGWAKIESVCIAMMPIDSWVIGWVSAGSASSVRGDVGRKRLARAPGGGAPRPPAPRSGTSPVSSSQNTPSGSGCSPLGRLGQLRLQLRDRHARDSGSPPADRPTRSRSPCT